LQFLLPARIRIRRGLKELEKGKQRGRSTRILLIIDDEADAMSSNSEARRLLGDLLENTQHLCVLILSRQPVYKSLGQSKVVNVRLDGLERKDAAKLFLQGVHRPLEFSDFPPEDNMVTSGRGPGHAMAGVQRNDYNHVCAKVSEHPLLYRLAGHPGRIRAMSSKVTPGGPSLMEMATNFSEIDLDPSPTFRRQGLEQQEDKGTAAKPARVEFQLPCAQHGNQTSLPPQSQQSIQMSLPPIGPSVVAGACDHF
jgi:hypothetical protein